MKWQDSKRTTAIVKTEERERKNVEQKKNRQRKEKQALSPCVTLFLNETVSRGPHLQVDTDRVS